MKRISAPPSSMWVAEEVATSSAAEVGLFDKFAHHAAENIGVEAFAVGGEEERFFVLIKGEFWADFFDVFLQPMKGAISDGGHSVFVPLPFPNLEDLALLVEVSEFQSRELAPADSAGVEEF